MERLRRRTRKAPGTGRWSTELRATQSRRSGCSCSGTSAEREGTVGLEGASRPKSSERTECKRRCASAGARRSPARERDAVVNPQHAPCCTPIWERNSCCPRWTIPSGRGAEGGRASASDGVMRLECLRGCVARLCLSARCDWFPLACAGGGGAPAATELHASDTAAADRAAWSSRDASSRATVLSALDDHTRRRRPALTLLLAAIVCLQPPRLPPPLVSLAPHTRP